jgi:multidrug efflux pump subunit AcrA (membrane-fusion protein)
MARGWESKSVESQRQDADAARERRAPATAEQRQREQKRHGLELSRARVLQQLAKVESPVRRQALEAALAHLDAELAALGAD